MNVESISYFSILSFIIFIVPIMFINYKLNIKINNRIIYSIIRMVIQLSVVGIFLQYIFDINNPILNLFYVILMMVIAGFSAVRSCSLKINKFLIPLFCAFAIPSTVILIFFNHFVIRLDDIYSAQYLIPIGGMILGNSLSGNIISINSFYKSIKTNEKEYNYTLSLSGSKIEALIPYFKDSILSSINPTLASIETIGLVALPGMMTGQILGGAIPLTAIKYQIAIMIAILISRYFSAILSILFTAYFAFDDYDMLAIKFTK